MLALLGIGCGAGVAPDNTTTDTEAGTQERGGSSRNVVLSVRSGESGICGQDRDFRFGVENHTRKRLTNGLLRFDPDGSTQTVICGAADGRCQLRNFSRDATAAEIARANPECMLRLAPGDDFACRAAVAQAQVQAVLTARVGGADFTKTVSAGCRPPPASDDFKGAFTVTIDDEICGGNDPTFRFGLRNPTATRLTDIFMRFALTGTGGSPQDVLVCGAMGGACDLQTIPAETTADQVARSFPDCALRLAPGDDFACRASLLQSRVDAVVSAKADGAQLIVQANATCPAPAPDECAAMVPASAGEGIEARPQDSNHESVCRGNGISDDGGNFAFAGSASQQDLSETPTAVFVTVQNGAAKQIGSTFAFTTEGSLTPFAQPSGFTVFANDEENDNRDFVTFSHTGKQVASVRLTSEFSPGSTSVVVAGDPTGGMAAVRTVTDTNGTHSTYQRFDAQGGALTDEIDIQASFRPLTVGVDGAGNALVLTATATAGQFQGRWFSRAGKALTDWFSFVNATLDPNRQRMDLVQIAGGLALRADDRFTLVFDDAKPSAGPLPAWLAVRATNQLAIVRSGRGYASWGTTGLCQASQMEILTTSGNSCGCVTVPSLSATTTVGRDGSVIAPEGTNPPQCGYRLFPRLLR